MSKSRDKGTYYETYLLRKFLVSVWPDADRSSQKGSMDYGDFINVGGWLVEAKNRKTWALPEWIRGVYSKQKKNHREGQPWVILFKADKRQGLKDDYSLIPTWLLVELLKGKVDV